jgi:orotidine-5'-phosphate decarboxylase
METADMDAKGRLIVALDVPGAAEALALVDRLEGTCRWFKVGMELYYAAGNSIVERLRGRGFEVFLDLKLHDIPNTVAGAVRSLAGLGTGLLTVHAGGGEAMLRAAAEAAAGIAEAPRLLAVTVLTSIDDAELNRCGVPGGTGEQVLRLARLASAAGIDGMVCSPEEVARVREALGAAATLVVPGIRAQGAAVDDQRRTASAAQAISRGASMLVVGRPITRASDPARAAAAMLEEVARAMRSPQL